MPVLQPAELWKRSGRYDIDEVFKLEDRRGAELVLAMTHEENLTFHIAREVRSYRDLPKLLYHFQTKERDEPRPRAGLLRTREFIMKDAYSFDRDAEGLDASYRLYSTALRPHLRPGRARVVQRGVRRRARWAASAPTSTWRPARPARTRSPSPTPATRPTSRWRARPPRAWTGCPSRRTARRSARRPRARRRSRRWPTMLGVPEGALIKAMPVVVEGRGPVLALVRGDHRLNEIKLHNALGAPFRQAEPEEVRREFGAEPGFIGPVGSPRGGAGRRGAARAPGARDGRQRDRRPPDAASSRAATSSPAGSTSAASRRATSAPTGARSASSGRSRSATSSSSAPATRSRSARATSTRRARSS